MKWKNLNLANKVTIIRFLFVPIIIFLILMPSSNIYYQILGDNTWSRALAMISILASLFIFIIAMITDVVDGYLARKYNMVTVFGKFLDPIVDKILIIGVWIAFVEIGLMSSVVPIIIIIREFIVTGVRILAMEKNIVIAAGFFGKIKTLSQVGASILIYLKFFFKKGPYASTNFDNFLSGLDYLIFFVLVIVVLTAFVSAWSYIKKLDFKESEEISQ